MIGGSFIVQLLKRDDSGAALNMVLSIEIDSKAPESEKPFRLRNVIPTAKRHKWYKMHNK